MIIFPLDADYPSEKVEEAISSAAKKLGWECKISPVDFRLIVEKNQLKVVSRKFILFRSVSISVVDCINLEFSVGPIPVDSRCNNLIIEIIDGELNLDIKLISDLFTAIKEYLIKKVWGDKDN